MKQTMLLLLPLMVSIVFFDGCNSSSENKDSKEVPAKLVDMKSFFKNGDKTSFQISPDGNYYSYRADYKGKMNIFVRKIGDTNAVRVSSDTLRSIGQYLWRSEEHTSELQSL